MEFLLSFSVFCGSEVWKEVWILFAFVYWFFGGGEVWWVSLMGEID